LFIGNWFPILLAYEYYPGPGPEFKYLNPKVDLSDPETNPFPNPFLEVDSNPV